ncbi:hypothetical protein QA584_22730 [Anaerocolumna sp. AGMB13025]|uniref:hypothetical protein n=1 Tax=Anaerocolumna sp. AGMB13025 TaxID=3039116 RepID=UPI00241D621C|nr:hypothetical protein [Anaerocolumna sp. AGMB13025]WFR56400.1 hypothetical protein QA584_22730 [Anaerocolumna sp. AGMB13025]
MPFLVMCYEYCNERRWYECDFPMEFMEYWKDKNSDEYKINYLVICGQWISGLKEFDNVIKALKG